QEAASAHLADEREPADRVFELVAETRAALADALDEALAREPVEHREPDRARQGRAVPGVTVLELARAVGERVVDVLLAEDRGEREIASPEPLPRAEHIRLERELLVGEPRPGPPHAGHDLVEADEEAVALAPLGQALPELRLGRPRRPRRRAHRLAEEGRDGLRPGLGEAAVELIERGTGRMQVRREV